MGRLPRPATSVRRPWGRGIPIRRDDRVGVACPSSSLAMARWSCRSTTVHGVGDKKTGDFQLARPARPIDNLIHDACRFTTPGPSPTCPPVAHPMRRTTAGDG